MQTRQTQCETRISLAANLVAVATIAIALLAVAFEALAHHPGSHAKRKYGQVEIDAVAVTTDSCTQAGGVVAGPPAGTAPVAGRLAATLNLARPAGAVCATVVGQTKAKATITDIRGATDLHLYIVDADSKLISTERVPIR